VERESLLLRNDEEIRQVVETESRCGG